MLMLQIEVAQWTAKFETRNGFKTTRSSSRDFDFDISISMILFEAALRHTQFNTTVKSNCSRTTMFTTN